MASSQTFDGPCSNAYDGVLTTAWNTHAEANGSWIVLNFSQRVKVNAMKYANRLHGGRNQRVSLEWDDMGDSQIDLLNDTALHTYFFPETTTRSVKITTIQTYNASPSDPSGASEIEFWLDPPPNVATATPVPTMAPPNVSKLEPAGHKPPKKHPVLRPHSKKMKKWMGATSALQEDARGSKGPTMGRSAGGVSRPCTGTHTSELLQEAAHGISTDRTMAKETPVDGMALVKDVNERDLILVGDVNERDDNAVGGILQLPPSTV